MSTVVTGRRPRVGLPFKEVTCSAVAFAAARWVGGGGGVQVYQVPGCSTGEQWGRCPDEMHPQVAYLATQARPEVGVTCTQLLAEHQPCEPPNTCAAAPSCGSAFS